MTEDKIITLGSPEGGFGGRSGWSPADFAAVMGNNKGNNGGIFGGNGMWDGVLGLFGLGNHVFRLRGMGIGYCKRQALQSQLILWLNAIGLHSLDTLQFGHIVEHVSLCWLLGMATY